MSKESMNKDTKVRTQIDVEQLELSYTAGGNVKPVWKTVWQLLTKLNIHLPLTQ